MSALHEFIEGGNDNECLRELMRGGDPNSQDGAGQTPLHILILKSERSPQITSALLRVAYELINCGADVEQGDITGCTPLHLATKCREYRLAEMLLEANADINKKDNNGFAALHHATMGYTVRRRDGPFYYDPDLNIVKLLLRYNPDIDIRDQTERTPLMLAVLEEDVYIVGELLRQNASSELQDSLGNTAMHYALSLPTVHANIVMEIARYEGSFSTPNNAGKTPQRCFFETLLNYPLAEVEKAKNVIKLFLIEKYDFREFEIDCIEEIDTKYEKCYLDLFLSACDNEILRMNRRKLAPNYKMMQLALRGAFAKDVEDHISREIFDLALVKLIRGRYPLYGDVIAEGICRPYMKKKFAQTCANIETGVPFFHFDALYSIASYLSNNDMVHIMTACALSRQRPSFWSRWCSIL